MAILCVSSSSEVREYIITVFWALLLLQDASTTQVCSDRQNITKYEIFFIKSASCIQTDHINKLLV